MARPSDRALVSDGAQEVATLTGFDPSRGGGAADPLLALAAKLKALRGTPEQWLEREIALTRFIAGLQDTTRAFCRGEVRLDRGHFPAILTYNTLYKQTLAWAPSGHKNALEGHHEGYFWSGVPHVGIAREVLMGPETVTCDNGSRPEGEDASSAAEGEARQNAAAQTADRPQVTTPFHDSLNRDGEPQHVG